MTQLSTDIGASAVIKLFQSSTASIPANCATADLGTLICTWTGNATTFGTAASGQLTANAVVTTPVVAAGSTTGTNPLYYRIYPTAATTTNAVHQGTAGLSGTDMILTNTSILAGQNCGFTSLVITATGA